MQETNLNSESRTQTSRKLVFIYSVTAVLLLTAGLIAGYVIGANNAQRTNNISQSNSTNSVATTSLQLSSSGYSSATKETFGDLSTGITWSCEGSQELLNHQQQEICYQIFANDTDNTEVQIDRIVRRPDLTGVTEGDVVMLGSADRSINEDVTEGILFIYHHNSTGSAYVVYAGNGELPECQYVDGTGWSDVFSICKEENALDGRPIR